MSQLSEHLLFGLVRLCYRSQVAHSDEMKLAQSSAGRCEEYRTNQFGRIAEAAGRYGVELRGMTVLDLGCNDGAITDQYPRHGTGRVVGVDVDAQAIERASRRTSSPEVEYLVSAVDGIPLPDSSIDVVVCFDVFEHVARPAEILAECRRVLRPGGKMLIGTWGWYHPFAPHLWATMPVPWAHVFFSERTVLRTCRRVFHSPWYVPTMHDLDHRGVKVADKYLEESISTDYLNKYLIRDFERVFRSSGLSCRMHLEPFGSRYARWTAIFLGIPGIREFCASGFWAVLTKAASS